MHCSTSLLFFWSLTPFFLPTRPVSPVGLLWIEFFNILRTFWMRLTNPSVTSDDRCYHRLCLASAPYHKLISAGLFPLLVGLNLLFVARALACFFKITQVTPFDSAEVFAMIHTFSIFLSLLINDFPASLPSSLSCFLCWRPCHLIFLSLGNRCWEGYTRSPSVKLSLSIPCSFSRRHGSCLP